MRNLIFLASTLIAALSLFAQNGELAPAPPASDPQAASNSANQLKAPFVEFSVYVLPQSQVMGTAGADSTGFSRAFYDAPSGIQQIYLRHGEPTPLQRYQGEGPLRIYDYVDTMIPVPKNAPPKTEPTLQREKTPIATIDLPDELSRFTVILLPNRKKLDGTYDYEIIPYESKGFEPGMARIQNNTKQKIILEFVDHDGETLKLEPKGSATFDPAEFSDRSNPRVIVYGTGPDKQLKALHTSRLLIKEKATNLFIVVPRGNRANLLRVGGD